MISTIVFDDLSSVSTSEDNTLECILPNYNPETMTPFMTKEEVISYAESVVGREFFWIPKLSDEEKAAKIYESAAESVRADRNVRLKESDWTQVADAPVDKVAWAAYRQALRDITDQQGFPHNVVWPTKP